MAGVDYTDEEFDEAEPSEYQEAEGPIWVPPPSELTKRCLRNLDKKATSRGYGFPRSGATSGLAAGAFCTLEGIVHWELVDGLLPEED
uniref:Uncharacterized protein n=1 Tax=Cannabis sativa TaxID=3483 RepID=A0A803NH63_CANSA